MTATTLGAGYLGMSTELASQSSRIADNTAYISDTCERVSFQTLFQLFLSAVISLIQPRFILSNSKRNLNLKKASFAPSCEIWTLNLVYKMISAQ